jgi:hypothetical protein
MRCNLSKKSPFVIEDLRFFSEVLRHLPNLVSKCAQSIFIIAQNRNIRTQYSMVQNGHFNKTNKFSDQTWFGNFQLPGDLGQEPPVADQQLHGLFLELNTESSSANADSL